MDTEPTASSLVERAIVSVVRLMAAQSRFRETACEKQLPVLRERRARALAALAEAMLDATRRARLSSHHAIRLRTFARINTLISEGMAERSDLLELTELLADTLEDLEVAA